MTQVRRGEVVYIDFGKHSAATMGKERPALVIQNDAGNRAAPHTIVAAIRHDTRKGLPIHVPLVAGKGGLAKDSVVDLGHILTVRMADIGRRTGVLGAQEMAEVDQALKISLGLR